MSQKNRRKKSGHLGDFLVIFQENRRKIWTSRDFLVNFPGKSPENLDLSGFSGDFSGNIAGKSGVLRKHPLEKFQGTSLGVFGRSFGGVFFLFQTFLESLEILVFSETGFSETCFSDTVHVFQ